MPRGLLPFAVALFALAALLSGCGDRPAEHLQADVALAPGMQESWTRDLVVDGLRTVTVPPGATLALDGIHVSSADERSRLAVTIEPGGNLVVKSSDLVAVRIRLQPGARADLFDSRLDQRAGGIAATGANLTLDHVTLDGSPESALQVRGGVARIRGSWFLASGGRLPALDAEDAAVAMDGGGFAGSASYGIEARRSRLWLNDTTVGATADYGLHAIGSTLALRGNTWRPFCAMFLVGGSSGSVDGDRFEARDRAVTLTDSGLLAIRGARFANAPSVIRAGNSSLAVSGSVLDGGTAAFDGSSVSWSDNTLGATVVEASGAGGDVRLHNNTWAAGAGVALRNTGASPVDATWNWWGDAAGPGGRVQGDVRADPWLRGPPKDA
jgi:hypothetical protein